MEKSTEHWSILGAGAIGHLLACHFAMENIEATLICRQSANKGNSLVSYKSEDYSQSCQLNYQSVDDCTVVDNLLLTVKSHQVEDAIKAIRPAITPSSRIYLLQNGMGTLEKVSQLLANQLDANRIFPGSNTHGAYLQKNKSGIPELVHAGQGHLIFGNNYLQTTEHKPPRSFKALKQLSLNTSWVDDIERRLWLKLAVNAVINPLTAINNCLNGELLNSQQMEHQLRQLCLETANLFQQMSISIGQEEIIQEVYDVIKKTSNNQSSMLQDRQQHKKTEIESITGYILSKANHYGIEMNNHLSLYQKINNF